MTQTKPGDDMGINIKGTVGFETETLVVGTRTIQIRRDIKA